MAKQKVNALVEAGKASAGPPLGPALGPFGLNIGQVIAEINKKTAQFAGMSVPVDVVIDTNTKTFEIEVGMPPTSQMIIKELGVKKGSGAPKTDKIGNLAIEQIIKIAKTKKDAMLSYTLKNAVLEVIGTCQSMGVLVEGEEPKDIFQMIADGKFDEAIKSERTEISDEKKRELAEELAEAKEEIAEEMAEEAAMKAEEEPVVEKPAEAPTDEPEKEGKEETEKKEK
jgi:large subunit ribosomal protein L11